MELIDRSDIYKRRFLHSFQPSNGRAHPVCSRGRREEGTNVLGKDAEIRSGKKKVRVATRVSRAWKERKKEKWGDTIGKRVLTGTFPLSSATRGGPPRGRRRQDRAVPSCGPTRPALYPCPFASPCRDPSPDPSSPSPLSPILCLAACARSPCSSPAPSRAHAPGFYPTLFRPQAATLQNKNRCNINRADSTTLSLISFVHAPRIFVIRSMDRVNLPFTFTTRKHVENNSFSFNYIYISDYKYTYFVELRRLSIRVRF